MVDSSKVENVDFRKVKQFLANFVNHANINPSQTHIGVLQYSQPHLASLEIRFDNSQRKSDILNKIDYMGYQDGNGRFTGQALQAVEKWVRLIFRYLRHTLFANA